MFSVSKSSAHVHRVPTRPAPVSYDAFLGSGVDVFCLAYLGILVTLRIIATIMIIITITIITSITITIIMTTIIITMTIIITIIE